MAPGSRLIYKQETYNKNPWELLGKPGEYFVVPYSVRSNPAMRSITNQRNYYWGGRYEYEVWDRPASHESWVVLTGGTLVEGPMILDCIGVVVEN